MSIAERMLDLMERGRAKTIRQSTLWDILLQADPALKVDVRKRQVLAEVIEHGVAAGRLRAPAARKKWSGNPPLPDWVVLQGAQRSQLATVPGHDYFWRPELRWAAELRFRREDLEHLKKVNAWLRDMPADEPVVPVRERSLEIFGDEKLLEKLMVGSKFFATGRLTIELLRARIVHPPFVFKVISAAPVLLVIENHHTFDSFARQLDPGSGVGVIAYGAGSAFEGSATYIADLPIRIDDVLYFGDIDPEGLRIPQAAGRLARAARLPDIVPAADLYSRLLANGKTSSGSIPVSPAVARRLARWLPEALQSEVEALLIEGKRIAQEAIGTKALLGRSWPLISSARRD
jgi:hypothetical protein